MTASASVPASRITAVPWDDPRGAELRRRQRLELRERYGDEDTEPGVAPSADDIAVFLIASGPDGVAIGCGALRPVGDDTAEIKRMYVSPDARGTGVATALLRALEDAARARGWTRLVLETGERQPDAIRFYEREGYARIPLFGHYIGSAISICLGRDLDGAAA